MKKTLVFLFALAVITSIPNVSLSDEEHLKESTGESEVTSGEGLACDEAQKSLDGGSSNNISNSGIVVNTNSGV